MGWKGYESTIAVGMLFKRMYCRKCAHRLTKKKISNVYRKGDPDFSNHILGDPTIGMDRVEKSYYIYHCPNCGLEITYDAQRIVAKRQKQLKRKIISESDAQD